MNEEENTLQQQIFQTELEHHQFLEQRTWGKLLSNDKFYDEWVKLVANRFDQSD